MKKIIHIILIISLLTIAASSTGCSRQPSMKRTTSIMQKYFKKYSKKYPESILGKYPVAEINLLHVEEVHRGFIAVYAILKLEGGMALQTRFTIQKKPFAWRANSWENMGLAQMNPGN